MKREPQTNLARKDVLFQYEEPQTNLAKKDVLFQMRRHFFITLIVTDFQNHVEYYWKSLCCSQSPNMIVESYYHEFYQGIY